MMERIFFAKIEVWVVGLLALLFPLGAVAFGYLVLDAEREKNRFGAVSQAALNLAEAPDTARQVLGEDKSLLAYETAVFEGKPSGWSFPNGSPEGPSGYLLQSYYDGDQMQNRIELLSMPDMKPVRSFPVDVDDLMAEVTHISRFSDHDNWNQAHFREIHPFLTADGGLILKDHNSPLFRVDACGRRRWTIQSQVFHHSTEIGPDGNFWIPGFAESHVVSPVKDSLEEDTLVEVTPDGRILQDISVPEILLRGGYAHWMFATGMYDDDPTHLNDIQPVMEDGPYWKKGDLFLSLRNVSTIMLYRPSTDEIVWMKRGPWLSQHDVDILDDHRISIYDNNAQDRGLAGKFYDGPSQIMVYDFATGEVTTPLNAAMTANAIRTNAAGLYTALPDGSSLVEDVVNARMLLLSPAGAVAAEFVNRAGNGNVYHLGWSRFIDKAEGDAILEKIATANCGA